MMANYTVATSTDRRDRFRRREKSAQSLYGGHQSGDGRRTRVGFAVARIASWARCVDAFSSTLTAWLSAHFAAEPSPMASRPHGLE
jgi:hypothetical protein